jgi:ribosomal protein S18 acetylase RimI-like enzyme
MHLANRKMRLADVTIQHARSDDVETLAPLFDAFRVSLKRPPDLEASRQFIKSRLELRDSVILLARRGDAEKVAGFVHLYPAVSLLDLCTAWTISDLYVVEEARRTGIGRALMKQAELVARSTGAAQLALTTAVTNERAQRLIQSLGYVRDAEWFIYVRKMQ